jgi:hypothetical protein
LKEEKFVENIRQIHLQVQEMLKKSQEKYKARHDQHRTEKSFKVGDRVWLQLNKERLQGPGKKIKALCGMALLRYWRRWEIMPTDSVYPHTCTFTQ